MTVTVTAIQATQNAGLHRVDEFDFSNGVSLSGWRRGPSLKLWEMVQANDYSFGSPFLPQEFAGTMLTAAGHLYKTIEYKNASDMPHINCRRNMQLVSDVVMASDAIALAGGRDTPRSPVVIQCGGLIHAINETIKFRGLSKRQQATDWRPDLLADADTLLQELVAFQSNECPRLGLAIDLESEAASLDFSRHWEARLTVAMSGLEAFCIDANEGQKFWQASTIKRIPRDVQEDTGVTKAWLESIARHRNAAVHRSLRVGKRTCIPLDRCAVSGVELLLRTTICYALENLQAVKYVLESGDWGALS